MFYWRNCYLMYVEYEMKSRVLPRVHRLHKPHLVHITTSASMHSHCQTTSSSPTPNAYDSEKGSADRFPYATHAASPT